MFGQCGRVALSGFGFDLDFFFFEIFIIVWVEIFGIVCERGLSEALIKQTSNVDTILLYSYT